MSNKELATELEPEVPQEEIAAGQPAEQEAPQEEQKPPEKPAEKVVPLAALHEERQRRKEIQAEIQRVREERARETAILQDRLNQIWQAQQPQQQFRDPEKDPDPLAAMQHNQNLLLQQVQAQEQRRQVEEAQKRQWSQQQQLVGWAQAQAAEFVQEAPDFGNAYQHMLAVRKAELEAMGMDPQRVQATLQENELWIYYDAAQSGKNPAEVIYNMAKAAGYGKTVEPPKQEQIEQKVETLQRGVKASANLSGAASSGKPTAEQIANMSDEEFAAFKRTLKRGQSISDVL